MNVTIPGTGPYYVSEIRPDGLTLSRNPHFRLWSVAAQPYPYPDHIRTQTAASRDIALADVLAGRADVFYPDLEDLPNVAGRNDQVHEFRILNTDWAYLNPRIPPFDNVKARQALNYAVDRRKFVTLYGGGPLAATISCQLLPSGFPAWRPYCPYQTGRHDGTTSARTSPVPSSWCVSPEPPARRSPCTRIADTRCGTRSRRISPTCCARSGTPTSR